MTTATVAQPDGNGFAVLLCMFLLVSFITCVVLWIHEQRSDVQTARIDRHDEQLATLAYQMPKLLEHLGIDIPPPVADDSPAAMADGTPVDEITRLSVEAGLYDDADTEEFPAIPPTEPDGIAIQVQSALIEAPEMIERTVNIGGTLQTFLIPKREAS